MEKEQEIRGRLENWSVVSPFEDADPYREPWQFLSGEVYGHENYDDGTEITTSRIIEVRGRFIETSSESVYELGKAGKFYVEWCKEQGCHIPTEEEPIKLLGEE